ncbi:MAG: hypothetical protein LBT05_08025 [Planctomycetaceae bacterium]|jgi:hypothetical protein|nr:hypothetical protein [Planctomycetaceae bacterium]
MNQTEIVIDAMRQNGGYATFGQLNTLVDFSLWKTKTPYASVRRIVQKNSNFFKIRPGLWALTEFKDEVLEKFQIKKSDKKQENLFTHSYYQGLLVEIGNMKKLKTCVPAQDKNRKFLEKPLREIVTLEKIYEFTYPEILCRATTVDVVWFNERKLPHSFFEVEHSTDIQNSLMKFFELQDYFARFFIVAAKARKLLFDSIINRSIFNPIKSRIDFWDYESIATQYSKMFELSQMKRQL